MRRADGLAALFLGGVAMSGCGSGRPRNDTPPGPSVAPPPVVAAPPPPLRVVPFEKGPVDPRALEVLQQNYAATPGVLDATPAPELTKAALEDTARAEARGLTLDDKVHVARLTEKGHAILAVAVKQGDCITVIAHGGLGVMEVDAFLVEHGSSPPKVLAQDVGAGPEAVLGGQRGCYPFVMPDPPAVDLVIQSRMGDGNVVFAVYRGTP